MPGNPNILINSATPEMLSSAEGLPIFFGWAERAHPQGVKDLVNLIGSILPQGGRATAREGRDGLTQETLEIGFETISSWLEDVGVGGFRQINVVKRKGLLIGALAKGINLAAKEKISDEGMKVLKSFSACLKRAEGGEREASKRVSPRRIVGDLLRESVGSRLSNNGSATLRVELVKALGGEGNLSWIRDALGIADVASQAGFVERVETPKGYKLLDRDSAAFLEVGRQGTKFFIGRHPADLACDAEGNFYFRLSEVPWPKTEEYKRWYFRDNNPDDLVARVTWGDVPENGVALTSGRDVYLESRSSAGYGDEIEIINHELAYLVSKKDETIIFLPYEVKVGGKTQSFADICDGIGIVQLRRGNGKVRVARRSGAVNEISIFVPSAAVIRPGVAEEERAEMLDFNRRENEARGLAEQARAEKPAEAELTLTEKVFVAMLEDLVGWEEAAGVINSGKLQKEFENMKMQFGRLPAGGRFRAKVMENVMSQLGAEGEKMKKASKKDEQIFEEWLKQVFTPLYRRARKQ